MNYSNIKAEVAAHITSNNANQITGEIVRNVLTDIITALGLGYQFMGFCTPTTNPGTPDARVFYIAQEDGTYVNFGSLQVVGISFLFWSNQWTAVHLNVSSGGGGGGTGITSIGLNMPSMFEVDPATPLQQNGTFNVTLKDSYVIPTATNWADVFDKRHTHSNKSILDGITTGDIQHWNAAYQAIGSQEGILPFNAPVVRIFKGRKADTDPTNLYASFIRVDHPLLALGGEVVLMVWNKRNRKKLGNDRLERNNTHWPRKGWFVARGWTGGDTWTFLPSGTPRNVTTQLYGLQAYIIQHYTRVGSNTRTQMASMSYVNWCNSIATTTFGFDPRSPKLRRKFGIAVRIVNPDWVEYASGSPSQWAQNMRLNQTTEIPRYFYSPVTPLMAQISSNSEDTYHQRLGLTPM